jgi:hypothetical protein
MEEKHLFPGQLISQKSIDYLISTKDKTEKYLTPTFALNIKDYLLKGLAAFKRQDKSGAQRELKFANVPGAKSLGLLGHLIKSIFNLIFSVPKFIWKLITGQIKPGEFLRSVSQWPKLLAVKFMEKLLSLRQINKTIFVVILLLIAGLIGGGYWLNYRGQAKKEAAAYADEVKRAKDEINNAQVNLIYKNEGLSLTFVKGAEMIINNLPQASTNQKAKFDELQKQINTIKNKLLHIEQIVPQQISELQFNGQAANLSQLRKTNGNLLVSTKDNAMFAFNLDSKTTSEPTFSEYGDLYHLLAEDDATYAITNQNKLIKYLIAEKKFSPVSITWGDGTEINGVQLYNNTIYVADAKNGQIFKYKKSADGFGTRETWLKDKGSADFSLAESITIDGNLYLATDNGKIYKFYTGKIQDFNPALIEPALSGVKKIFTNADLDNLYLLETGAKRIVLINKTGAFTAQYVFDSLPGEIKDFVIDQGIIYLISENKIFQATIK